MYSGTVNILYESPWDFWVSGDYIGRGFQAYSRLQNSLFFLSNFSRDIRIRDAQIGRRVSPNKLVLKYGLFCSLL